MTEFDANRLLLMLMYNFGGFLPNDIDGAVVKKSMWLDEFRNVDVKVGEAAVKTLIQTLTYPPKIADFRALIGKDQGLTRDEMQARLPGPTFDSEEGMKALYTCDMARVDRLMADLDMELARMPGFEREKQK